MTVDSLSSEPSAWRHVFALLEALWPFVVAGGAVVAAAGAVALNVRDLRTWLARKIAPRNSDENS